MIRDLVQKQLDRCQFADLTHRVEGTNTFNIPKYSADIYTQDHCYLIKLPMQLVNNTNSVTAVNWNNGTAPSTQYLKIYVTKILGPMIGVDSLGFDFENNLDLDCRWTGWLNTADIKQVAKLM